MTLNARHLHVLQHSLGLDEHGRTSTGALCPAETYRNRFVTDDDSDDGALCLALVDAGLMVRHGRRAIFGGMSGFAVTDAGRAYVREHSPPPPKMSRSRRRYLEWLRIADVSGLSFGDFLRGKGATR